MSGGNGAPDKAAEKSPEPAAPAAGEPIKVDLVHRLRSIECRIDGLGRMHAQQQIDWPEFVLAQSVLELARCQVEIALVQLSQRQRDQLSSGAIPIIGSNR